MNSPAAPESGNDRDDYALKVDEQTQKLIELNHQLTYFLITAATVSLGFTVNTALSNKAIRYSDWLNIGSLIAAAAGGLLSAGLSLVALNADIRSFRLHLKYRYSRTDWNNLSKAEKDAWDETITRASKNRKRSFALLILSVCLQAFFLIYSLRPNAEASMHHYGEDSTEVLASEGTYVLVFRNKSTGREITMNIPRDGVTETGTPLTRPAAENLSRDIAHLLRERLR